MTEDEYMEKHSALNAELLDSPQVADTLARYSASVILAAVGSIEFLTIAETWPEGIDTRYQELVHAALPLIVQGVTG